MQTGMMAWIPAGREPSLPPQCLLPGEPNPLEIRNCESIEFRARLHSGSPLDLRFQDIQEMGGRSHAFFPPPLSQPRLVS